MRPRMPPGKDVGREAALVLGLFLLAGVIGGLLWWQVTPLAEWTRTQENGSMDEEQLSRLISVDGWFFVIAGVGGLLSGFTMAIWRKRDPVLMVVLTFAGACLATLVMYLVGHSLGPGDVQEALNRANEGDRVPVRLEPQARGVHAIWPLASLFGVLAVLWGSKDPSHEIGEDGFVKESAG